MVEPVIFLFLGDDELTKDSHINSLKERLFAKAGNLVDFDIDDVDAQALTLQQLQEIFARLPIASKKRLVVIRQAQVLTEPQRDWLLKFIKGIDKHQFYLALSVREDKRSQANWLVPHLAANKRANIVRCFLKRKLRVFDLARSIIDSANPANALLILNKLLGEGKQPQQILGGLFWYWNNAAGLRDQRQRRDVQLFLDTDTKIKTGKVSAELALEVLVLKLCQ
jgi:DNA polymerase III delta subunit